MGLNLLFVIIIILFFMDLLKHFYILQYLEIQCHPFVLFLLWDQGNHRSQHNPVNNMLLVISTLALVSEN